MIKLFLAIFLAVHAPLSALGALSDLDKADIPSSNILVNPGFESGKASWSVTGGSTSLATSGVKLGLGKTSLCWDASAAGQKLQSALIPIPNALLGANGSYEMMIRTSSGSATHKIRITDGTNTIGGSEQNIYSSGNYFLQAGTFIFPASGSIRLEVEANQDEPEICLDLGKISKANNSLGPVSQAQWIGRLQIENCNTTWASSANAWTSMTPVSSCTYVAVGNAAAPATQIPAFIVPYLDSGTLKILGTGQFYGSGAGSANIHFRYWDGVNSKASQVIVGSPTENTAVEGSINYTTPQTNLSIEVQIDMSFGSGAGIMNAPTGSPMAFDLYYYPAKAQLAMNPNTIPSSFSGHYTTSGQWLKNIGGTYTDFNNTNAATLIQDSNVNMGTCAQDAGLLPSIQCNNFQVGKIYNVCATPTINVSSGYGDVGLSDGTTVFAKTSINFTNQTPITLCGDYTAASTNPIIRIVSTVVAPNMYIGASGTTLNALTWNIHQVTGTAPAPIVTGSVTSSSTSALKIENASIAGDGSCTVFGQSGSWIAGTSHTATGKCTLTLTGFSVAPWCVCMPSGLNPNATCQTDAAINFTSTSWSVLTGEGGSASDRNFLIMCMGPR